MDRMEVGTGSVEVGRTHAWAVGRQFGFAWPPFSTQLNLGHQSQCFPELLQPHLAD